MQSLGRTTTALNVNKLFVRDKVFSQWRLLKQCKIFFFFCHRSNFIDDEEFLALSDLFERKNPCFPYEDYSPFNLDEMTESECLSEFRFRKKDIQILADVLGHTV